MKTKNNHTKKKYIVRKRRVAFILLTPIILVLFVYFLNHQVQQGDQPDPEIIPNEYIPIYKAAEEKYHVPWYLLAAHHRVETIFSTMDPMVSPVGAEGHMQIMPCTFVGWSHPSCEGLGKGNIPDEEKVNPEVIKKYNGYGTDANNDGIADPWDIEDAIFTAAYYLADHGAASGELEAAIFAYNHSEQYVSDILYYVNLYKDYYEETQKDES